jgi:hypothetical protein
VFGTPTFTARAVSSCQHPPRCNSGRGTQRTWVGNPPPETFGTSASWHGRGDGTWASRIPATDIEDTVAIGDRGALAQLIVAIVVHKDKVRQLNALRNDRECVSPPRNKITLGVSPTGVTDSIISRR